MSQENVELVRGLYETWNRTGGVPPWGSIDPNIDVEFTGGLLKGRYRGHAGMSEALESFWGYFDEAHIDVEDYRASGDIVLVTLRYFARGKVSGVGVDMPGWHVWTIQGGKAVRWLVVATRREALEAAGLKE